MSKFRLFHSHGEAAEDEILAHWKQFSVDVESVPESTGSTGFFARLTGITRAARMELVADQPPEAVRFT